MKPTDIAAPDYFHKVVDCQWACPAHTPVPEYIRLIAAGRYGDAYMINWKSNVFPGILGRTCDRPCEPACRRGRVEKEPVAICRLKRVAADYKDDITRAPAEAGRAEERQAHRAGRRRPGLARRSRAISLRSAITASVFDQDPQAGGMMRTQIPKFRLPETVIDEEMRLHPRSRHRVRRRQAHRQPEGAARRRLRRDLRRLRRAARARSRHSRPQGSRREHPHRHRLAVVSVSFGHIDKIGKRVIVLGGGNTAMDCCRSSRRLGGEDVKVIVRSGFEEMKASPWEKEDAMHEDIPIHNFLVPKEFTHDNGKLTGVRVREGEGRVRRQGPPQAGADRRARPASSPATTCWSRSARRTRSRGSSATSASSSTSGTCRRSIRRPCGSTNPKVFFGGDAAFGPKNIIWAVAHGHDAALSIHKMLSRRGHHRAAAAARRDRQPEDGHPRVELRQRHLARQALQVPLRDKVVALRDIKAEVELGFDRQLALDGSAPLPELRRADRVHRPLCIECDACVDICPMDCITFTPNGEEAELRTRLKRAGQQPDPGPLCRRRPQDRPRHGEGRGRLPALRPVRRALPDRRLGHAEIPHRYDARGRHMPTPSPISSVNDFVVRFANVNGSGSASANELFARADPAHGRAGLAAQHLPVEHPGPADLVRGARHRSRPSRRARRRRPDGRDEPADLGQGRRLDRARRLPVLRFDQADAGVEIPRRHQRHRRAADRDLQQRTTPIRASASCSRTSSMSARCRRCSTWTCRRSRS